MNSQLTALQLLHLLHFYRMVGGPIEQGGYKEGITK